MPTHIEAQRVGRESVHFVYRAFDAAGVLLYVGCTRTPSRRMAKHRGKAWYARATRITWAQFPDFWTARREEHDAIRDEAPLFNACLVAGARVVTGPSTPRRDAQ